MTSQMEDFTTLYDVTSTPDFENENGTIAEVPGQPYQTLWDAGQYMVLMRKFFICPVGILGNILSVIVLSKKGLRSSSLTPYLLAIAISDALYLFSDTFNHIVFLSKWTVQAYCMAAHYVALVVGTYSDFLVAAVAIHRAIAIKVPHKAQSITTRGKANIVISSVLFILAGLYLEAFWTFDYNPVTGWCKRVERYKVIIQVEATAFLVNTIVALVVISVCSAVIVRNLREQRKLMSSLDSSAAVTTQAKPSKDSQIGAMLTSIAILYLVTNFPLATYMVVDSVYPWSKKSDFHTVIHEFFFIIVYNLKNLNHALNFILYCHSAAYFRQQALNLVCSLLPPVCRCRARQENTEISSSGPPIETSQNNSV